MTADWLVKYNVKLSLDEYKLGPSLILSNDKITLLFFDKLWLLWLICNFFYFAESFFADCN